MRNISILKNYNELVKEYENLQERRDKVLLLIEKEGGNKGWEYEKKMPEIMVKKQIEQIYNILRD